MARPVSPPARPASSMMATETAPGCSAAAGSRRPNAAMGRNRGRPNRPMRNLELAAQERNPSMSGLKPKAKAIAAPLDEDAILSAYARWAPVYDNLFGVVTIAGRRVATDVVNRLP